MTLTAGAVLGIGYTAVYAGTTGLIGGIVASGLLTSAIVIALSGRQEGR